MEFSRVLFRSNFSSHDGDSIPLARANLICLIQSPVQAMFSIFRRKKSGKGVEATQLRPAEKSGADPLEQRLERTRSSLGGLFGLIGSAKRIDDSLIEEIETTLLVSDMGVAATTRIIDRLREGMEQDRKSVV